MSNFKDKLKYGGFSIVITVLVIIAVFAVNIFATYVENNNGLRLDFTPTRSYTLDRNAEAAITNLNTNVKIYTFIPKDSASNYSTYTQNIAAMFDGASDKITYVNVDPRVNPSKLEQFSSDTKKLGEFSVVVCQDDDESNYQAFNENELYEYNENTMKEYFVLQRIMTSALIYMRTGNKPNVYILTGHGEDVSSNETLIMLNRIRRENCNVEEINLLTDEKKLQQGDILVVLEPESDLAKGEYEEIRSFLSDSYGRMLFMCSRLCDDSGQPLANYRNLLDNFHITLEDGFVAETNNKNYYNNSPKHIKLIADQTHDISKSVRSANEPVYVNETASYSYNYSTDITTGTHTETFTNILTSYQSSVLVPWENSSDYEVSDYELGIRGIGCAYERKNTSISGTLATTTTRILLFGSDTLATGEYLGNSNILRNGINWLAGRESSDYIVSVGMSIDLSDHYVQLTQFQTQVWFSILVVAVPAVIFVFGIVVWLRRKNL